MPIYEYQCTKCGHTFERLQKVSDEPLIDCPECNQAKLKKLVSAPAFQLKGTGWYQTDFKGGNQSTNQKNEAPATSTSESKAEPVTKASDD